MKNKVQNNKDLKCAFPSCDNCDDAWSFRFSSLVSLENGETYLIKFYDSSGKAVNKEFYIVIEQGYLEICF